MAWEEPTERNSNLLPVKAKGEVRLRSVLSRVNTGNLDSDMSMTKSLSLPMEPERTLEGCCPLLASTSFKHLSKAAPKNAEITAGGASLAPRRCTIHGPFDLVFASIHLCFFYQRVMTPSQSWQSLVALIRC